MRPSRNTTRHCFLYYAVQYPYIFISSVPVGPLCSNERGCSPRVVVLLAGSRERNEARPRESESEGQASVCVWLRWLTSWPVDFYTIFV
jgi:hypothetical protein